MSATGVDALLLRISESLGCCYGIRVPSTHEMIEAPLCAIGMFPDTFYAPFARTHVVRVHTAVSG